MVSDSRTTLLAMILNITSFPRSGNSFFTTTLLAFGNYWHCAPSGRPVEFQPVRLFTSEHDGSGISKLDYLYPQSFDQNPQKRIVDNDRVFVYKRHDHPDGYLGPRIYLVRDGRDVMVSYAHHNLVHGHFMKYAKLREEAPPFEPTREQFEAELEELIDNVSWGDYVLHGVHHPNTRVVVHYERMKQDPILEATRALEKCGYSVERAQDPPSFEKLHSTYPWFYRRGKTGAFADEMPPRLHKRFVEKNEEALRLCGYLS